MDQRLSKKLAQAGKATSKCAGRPFFSLGEGMARWGFANHPSHVGCFRWQVEKLSDVAMRRVEFDGSAAA